MTMTPCDINPHIRRYMDMVEREEIEACEDQKLLVAHVKKCFETEPIYTDAEQVEHYFGMAKYLPFDRVFEWQEFVLALHLCTYREDGLPRWPDLFCLIGRGAGKDGTIALESICLMSPYNGIKEYDVDICANNEEQAMRPLKDVTAAFENPAHLKKLRRHFNWTKEEVVCRRTRSTLKGRTNSPKGKDGLRSGIVIFNEIHQYQNYDNINVFTTGLGKKKHPRRSYFTTNGNVRDGPLDDMLQTAEEILRGGEPDNGLLPFICRLDKKEEVHDPSMWPKANPSLPYLPNLQEEIKKEYQVWVKNPEQLTDFMTKRMNLPESNQEIAVTKWENIAATNRERPELKGRRCVVGIDYASMGDFASVDLHFRQGNLRYDICHSWLCLQSKDLPRIKAPWRDWAKAGLITPVDEAEIHPELLTDYIMQAAQKYSIAAVAIDQYRVALISEYLQRIGFSREQKNLRLVKPGNIMQTVPVIDSMFANQYLIWGDDPVMRWAAYNTKKVRSSRAQGSDTGNYYYAKIEARSRKTDPFMAFTAAVTAEDVLGPGEYTGIPDIGVMKF